MTVIRTVDIANGVSIAIIRHGCLARGIIIIFNLELIIATRINCSYSSSHGHRSQV